MARSRDPRDDRQVVCRHEQALSDLFSSVLVLCEKAGLVKSGIVVIDGTKLHANARRDSNFDNDRIAKEIIGKAIATDQLRLASAVVVAKEPSVVRVAFAWRVG